MFSDMDYDAQHAWAGMACQQGDGTECWQKEYCRTLFNLAKGSGDEGLEVGFHTGCSSLAYLAARPNGKLISVDMNVYPDGVELIRRRGFIDRLTSVQGDSGVVLKEMVERGMKFDWIYVDGDHSYDGVKRDLAYAAVLIKDDGILALDDCDEKHSWFGIHRAVTEFLSANNDFEFYWVEGNPNKACYLTKKNI